MKKMINVFYIGLALIFVGCSNNSEPVIISNSEENPTAEEIFKGNSEADILMYNGVIYNTNIDWVDELTLTKGDQVGEIKEQAMEGNYDYSNEMANKLTVGSIIYEAKERDDVLIVEDSGESHYYYALVEG
ncbi:hypothetical protein [Alkalicoccobacillus murimartini]|uniref:DUF3221 domain-containing protein n=1 Tax=Alkalicoccobacillus murimartini TaxID=171685 RepID=A0ABT9YLW4_9BACI|nr:hypothetical protein [Alkalicoccobacillus murimartini]MDQ0208629.1 hypothetical protein [Alkalicoccobacillus murimartini]